MMRRPLSSTRTDTLFPYPTRFRSGPAARPLPAEHGNGGHRSADRPVQPPLHGVASVDPAEPERQPAWHGRSEEHTSELQSLMRISSAVFCLKKKKHDLLPDTNTHVVSNLPTNTNKNRT